jgi:WD and tetratricopeptide repeat-containing protein 1
MLVFIVGKYVANESDDGHWFKWKKKTGRLIKILVGDENGTIMIVSMYSRL